MSPRHPHHGGNLRGRKFYPPPLPPRNVGGSVPCVRCGYNLKTLQLHWRCPECGLMVDWSMARHAAGRASARAPFIAVGVALVAFCVLESVDPAGPFYPSAVVFFVSSLSAATMIVLEQLRRNRGMRSR